MDKLNVVIIGASSGIGCELAKMYAIAGNKVVVMGRRIDRLNDLNQQYGNSMLVYALDINNNHDIVNRLNEISHDLGKIDVILLSSGIGEINKALDNSIELSTIQTNVTGFTTIANWSINYFIQQKHGHFAAISSIGGLRGSGLAPAYNATKAFQINYLEGLKQKVSKLPFKIHITDVRPGLVDTAMAKGEGLFWVMPLEKASKQIFKGLLRKSSVIYVTKRWRLIAFVLKLLPRSLYIKMS